MIKKTIFILIISIILLHDNIFADTKEVPVSLPTFDVQLNDVKINNTYSQYPFIVYDGITYFPMTFYDCHFIGLETTWSEENGLYINNTGAVSEYNGYETSRKNSRTYQASIPSFDITINDKLIDNSKEKYPLLLFRNVTYFPLTWHFIVDEFNWKYDFDQNSGLSISSQDLSVQKLTLPFEEKNIDRVEIFDGYYYYSVVNKAETNIYRTPINDFSNILKIHKIDKPFYSMYEFAPLVSFFKRDNELFFEYHMGGCFMGKDMYYRVNKNGKAENIASGYLFFKMIDKDMVILSYNVPPSACNLYYKKYGQDDYKYLGNKLYSYGWIRHIEGEVSRLGTSENMDIVNEWVYTTGFEYVNKNDENKIYKININTNKMVLVSDIPVDKFSILNDNIYFINSQDGKLHSMTLDGEKEKVIINEAIDKNNYIIDEDTIYYITKESKELYKLNNKGIIESMLPNKKVSRIKLTNKKLVCILDDEDYGLVIFDKDSNQIFKTSDRVSYTTEEGNLLIYKVYESGNYYTVQLP